MTEAIVAGAVAGAIAGAITALAIATWRSRGRAAERGPRWRSFTSRANAAETPRTAGTHVHGGPFDRFNDRAKRVLALAQDEAIRLGHDYIGTEHLLAALVREGEGVAAQVLMSLGADLSRVRSALEHIVGRGPSGPPPSEITLSPRTKKVVELAADEARKLGHSHVGTEHLLLGILRDGEGIATGILASLGIPLETVRPEVIATLGRIAAGEVQPDSRSAAVSASRGPFDDLDDPAKRTLALAQDEAMKLRHGWIGTEHLLLGLLRGEGVAHDALDGLGVTLDAARAAIEKAKPKGPEPAPSEMTLTSQMRDIISRAKLLQQQRHRSAVSPTLLLLALVSDPVGIGTQVLAQLGATPEKVCEAVERLLPPRA